MQGDHVGRNYIIWIHRVRVRAMTIYVYLSGNYRLGKTRYSSEYYCEWEMGSGLERSECGCGLTVM